MDLADVDLTQYAPDERAIVEEFLAVQDAILRAAETGAISTYIPYPHQERLHESLCTSRFLLGANRIGKSKFLVNEVRWFAIGEHPYRKLDGPAKLIWCCCPTEELMLMYQFPEVKAALGGEGGEYIERVLMGAHPRIILKNGCIILFKYYAQAQRAFPSAGVDLIAFDEEPPWAIYEECTARRSARILNMIGAITTIGGLTPFITKIVNNGIADCHYETARLDDNPAIPPEEREKFKYSLRDNPVAYAIRVEGKILAVGGTTRFDANALWAMQKEDVKDPLARFDFDYENERWVQTDTGPLWIWNWPDDEHEYCIGGDIAEGLNVSESDVDPVWDNTSLMVLNRITRRFDCEFTAGNVEPGKIGDYILPRISSLYNRAWANIEINNHGYTVVSHARKQMGGRLWSPIKDQATKDQKPMQALGTLMSTKSRKAAIDALAVEIVDRSVVIPSGHAVREMMQFIRKANGRIEHADGEHDDRVFGCAHAVTCDRGLPPPRIHKKLTEKDRLRQIAFSKPKTQRRTQWFRKIA